MKTKTVELTEFEIFIITQALDVMLLSELREDNFEDGDLIEEVKKAFKKKTA